MGKQKVKYKRTLQTIQDNVDIVLRNFAFIGIFLCVLLLVIIFYQKGVDAIVDLLINIVSTIIGGLFIFFIWDRIKNIMQDEKQTKLIDDVLESINGIRRLPPEDAFKKACNTIDKLSSSSNKDIRVIGSSKSPVVEYINEYYAKTNVYLSNQNSIKYRRITSYTPSSELQNHINTLFTQNSDKQNDVKVMFVRNFTQTHNYIILGDKLLLLVLSYFENDTLNTMTFCTENIEIINSYVNHFQNVWKKMEKKEKVANDNNSFHQLLSYYSGLESSFLEIKNSILKVDSECTLLQKHITSEVTKFDDYFSDISEGKYEINHHKTQNELLRTFCFYLDNIDSNYVFSAISFYQFWINLLTLEKNNTTFNFLKSNINALNAGALLSRVLVIDERLFNNNINENDILFDGILKSEYRSGISKILKANIEQLCSYTNYKFKILFTVDHEQMRNRFINFALIEKSSQNKLLEAVLLEASTRNSSDITKWIYYTYSNKTNQNISSRNTLSLIKQKKIEFNNISENEWGKQNITNNHREFLMSICPDYFIDETNFKKHLP